MAVLPLIGRFRLDTTCLVIGAMSPDFEYFARVKQQSEISHTWLGLVVFDLPATLILAAVFHLLVKWPAVLVTPRFIAQRAAVFAARPFSWSIGFAVACVVSSLIGAVTHLLWDGITHSDGVIVSRVHALRTPIDLPLLANDMALHRVIQHASTLLGLLGCTWFAIRALRRVEPVELPPRPRVWPRLVAIALMATGAALAPLRISAIHQHDIGNRVVVMIAGALGGAVLASLILYRTARVHSAR